MARNALTIGLPDELFTALQSLAVQHNPTLTASFTVQEAGRLLGQREVTFSDLTRAEWNRLQYIDHYAPDRRVFPLLEIEVLDADLVRALGCAPH